MSQVIDCKEIASKMSIEIKDQIDKLKRDGINPSLALIRVGKNPSDLAYEKGIEKKTKELGINLIKKLFPVDVNQKQIIQTIDELNNDNQINGVLLFRPLPKNLDEEKIKNSLHPSKDIDCINEKSLLGLFVEKGNSFAPCTAQSVVEILHESSIEISGKKIVVIGRSLVVGKPLVMLLLNEGATCTVCHSKTKREDLINFCKNADIIISAAGRRNIVSAECVTGKQIVIDVGINVDDEGHICGDVDFDNVVDNVKAITKVPGGVGTLTTTILAKHLIESAKNNI